MNWERLVLFLFVVLVRVQCDYELQVRLEHYSNSRHLQADGELCCDNLIQDEGGCSCSNRFTICIQPKSTAHSGSNFIHGEDSDCPDGWRSYVTGIIGEDERDPDNISFKDKHLIDPLKNVSNPIVISGQGDWPGSFQLIFAITNRRDMFEESLVDVLGIKWDINGGKIDYETKDLEGIYYLSRILISARITCTDDTHGDYCNQTILDEDKNLNANASLEVQENDEYVGNQTLKDSKKLNIASGYKSLVIGLSVMGAIFGVLIIASFSSFLSYLSCCFKKNRTKENERGNSGEKEPFLKSQGSDFELSRHRRGPYHGTGSDSDEPSHSYQDIEGESNSNIYTEVQTNRVQHRVLSQMAESARRASLQPPGTGTYSIIRKGDFVVGTPGLEDDSEEEAGGASSAVGSYSMITRESLAGYVSEELSDVAEVDEEAVEEERERKGSEVTMGHRTTEREGSLTRQEAEDEEVEDDEVEDDEVDDKKTLLQHPVEPEYPADIRRDSSLDRPRMPTPPPAD